MISDTIVTKTANLTITDHIDGIEHWVQEREKLKLEEESLVPIHVIHSLQQHFRKQF